MSKQEPKYVYLLLNIVEYHGGTRGIELGVYTSLKQAEARWKKYLEENSEEGEEQAPDDYLGKKIMKIPLNMQAENWCGKSVSGVQ